MIKKYSIASTSLFVLSAVLIAGSFVFIERTSAEETNERNLATDVAFSEKLPSHIDIVNVGFDYVENKADITFIGKQASAYDDKIGRRPVRRSFEIDKTKSYPNDFICNIVPEWNYSLIGTPFGDGVSAPDVECFPMRLLREKFREKPSENDDPAPWLKNGMREYILTHETPVIQQRLGYFFCNYGLVKKGDIFPLANQLYYVDGFLSATKIVDNVYNCHVADSFYTIKINDERRVEIKGLCIPLTNNICEVASQANFSYLPGLNCFVSRIALVPSANRQPHYVARICSNKNIDDVTPLLPGYNTDLPGRPIMVATPSRKYIAEGVPYGRPLLQASPEDEIDIEKKRMEIQEVAVGDIIKGTKLGYRVLKIVPPDPFPYRPIANAPQELKGRIVGWVDIDPKPIPLDEDGNPIDENLPATNNK